MNLEKITSGDELVSLFPDKFNSNMDALSVALQLANEYDASTSYAVGDYCSHEGTLYRCTTATTGTWDASKWTDNVIVLNALKTLKGRMDTAESEIDAAQSDISALNQSLTHISDNGWSVIKYPDGTFEATASLNLNYAAGSAWGSSGFYFHKSADVPIPSSAVSISLFFASPYGSQLCWVVGTTPISTSGFAIYVTDATVGATSGHPLSARMVGRWQ